MTEGLSQADLTVLRQDNHKEGRKDFPAFHSLLLAFRCGPGIEGLTLSLATKARIAAHETGHTMAAYYLHGPETIEAVSIIPAVDGSLGAFVGRSAVEFNHLGSLGVQNCLPFTLGGRSAELIQFPSEGQSEGDGADLVVATDMAIKAIGDLDLDDQFPCVAYSALPPALQQCLGNALLAHVEVWIEAAIDRCTGIPVSHRASFDLLVEELSREEVLHRAHNSHPW